MLLTKDLDILCIFVVSKHIFIKPWLPLFCFPSAIFTLHKWYCVFMNRKINLYIYVFSFICIFYCIFYSFTLKLIRYVAFEWIKRRYIWDKVFKNGPREICWWHPLKNLKWHMPKQTKTAIITFGHLSRYGDVVEPEMKWKLLLKLSSPNYHQSSLITQKLEGTYLER